MQVTRSRALASTVQRLLFLSLTAAAVVPCTARAQGLTGTLIGTIKDAQDGAIAGAVVRLTSPA